MSLKAGVRLSTTASTCEVLVVKGPAGDGVLVCAGESMADGAGTGGPSAGQAAVQLGKRYHDETSGLEVLCVKAGSGPLQFDGRPLELRAAKPLPASD